MGSVNIQKTTLSVHETSGQSYNDSSSINYDSSVILTGKVFIFTTLET